MNSPLASNGWLKWLCNQKFFQHSRWLGTSSTFLNTQTIPTRWILSNLFITISKFDWSLSLCWWWMTEMVIDPLVMLPLVSAVNQLNRISKFNLWLDFHGLWKAFNKVHLLKLSISFSIFFFKSQSGSSMKEGRPYLTLLTLFFHVNQRYVTIKSK